MYNSLIKNKNILINCGTVSLGSELVRNRVRPIHATEDIDIIFHTVELKHVMACEYNPFGAVNHHFKYC